MTKVLNIISDSNIGGAGRVLLNYLRYSDKDAFETSVCVPRGSLLSGPLSEAGADVHELDIAPDKSFSLGDAGKLAALIDTLGPDLVHTHGSFSGRIAARRRGVPVIYTRHSVFPVPAHVRSGPGRLVNKLFNERTADRIIAVSPAAKDNLTDAGIRPELIDIVMNGVEPVRPIKDDERAALRAQLELLEGCFTLGILARLEEYKGHMIILDALKLLTDEGRSVHLLIAGTGAYEDAVRGRAHTIGLSDHVSFLGFVTDVAPLLGILDVQLNASYGTEASSLSLLEGMSLGLPAIVSDYGGNPYVIEDGQNGLVFKSRDARALAGCIRRLMDGPQLRQTLSQTAREMYESRYTGQIFARNIEAVYTRTLKGADHGQ